MRADRLLSILMLLQSRGSMTAAELAGELEVSERTIYRDMTALSTAGIPVYADRGPGGGVRLLEEYRTNLTGLTADEARALFMLSIPAPLDQLGVGQELRAAMLKLSAALPSSRRPDEERARQRIHIDSLAWFQGEDPVPHLHTLQQAVWQDRRLRLTWQGDFNSEITREVDPYGLVAKANLWYLVTARENGLRVLRAGSILQADLLDETFTRPDDFDLAAFWKNWTAAYEQNVISCTVRARIAPDLVPLLPRLFGASAAGILARATKPDRDGWREVTLVFEDFFTARTRLLGMGRAVEVLAPVPLRESLIDFARQVGELYDDNGPSKL
jgi:predicted DNA-binding transcriptional regulator YafY